MYVSPFSLCLLAILIYMHPHMDQYLSYHAFATPVQYELGSIYHCHQYVGPLLDRGFLFGFSQAALSNCAALP